MNAQTSYLTQQHATEQLWQDMNVLPHVTLADKTWFKTGGTAEWFAEPTTSLEMSKLLQLATRHAMNITLLGSGANILVSDEGISGLVIRPAMATISHIIIDDDYASVTVGAGASFSDVIAYCLTHHLLGLEEFSGIPGTVGGSVFINIHYFQWLLSNFLVHATVINRATGTIDVVDRAWFAFSYNYSMLHTKEHVLADATFLVRRATPLETAHARGRHDEMIRHRAQRYPTERTCGSFFRNFYPHEVTETSNGKLMIYVAYYLDTLGVKGRLSYRKAIVSHRHANMIVTQDGATSGDVIELARILQDLMYQRFHVTPQPECQLLGFTDNPLLP